MGEVQTLVPGSFDCPNGTISVEILQREQLIRVYTEPVVDRYDWFILHVVLRRLGVDAPVFAGPWHDHGVDVWLLGVSL